jgi:hypothetical protein
MSAIAARLDTIGSAIESVADILESGGLIAALERLAKK